jgi:hypothetical protein
MIVTVSTSARMALAAPSSPAWETPYWEEYFQRSDAIFYKLASGEIGWTSEQIGN